MAVVTLDEVDQAFYDRFGGTVSGVDHISNTITVNGKNVNIFIGDFPRTEDPRARDRKFPAIVVNLIHLEVDLDRLDDADDIIISEDTSVSPPTRTVSKPPEPYELVYTIHMFSRRVREDRELVTKVLASILARDKLEIDSNRVLYMTRGDAPARLNETESDQMLYHSVIQVSVFCEIAVLSTETHTQIVEAHSESFNGVESPVLDRRITITDAGDTVSFTEF